jgi:hypothetical protein
MALTYLRFGRQRMRDPRLASLIGVSLCPVLR